MLIRITHDPVNIEDAVGHVRRESCGAVSVFQGDIRNENQGEQVIGLEYEVYENLFRAETERIFMEITERWTIGETALIQRVGNLTVGETGIVIAISSPHSADALSAVAYAIQQFKNRVPVWKKETTAAGEKWINWQ